MGEGCEYLDMLWVYLYLAGRVDQCMVQIEHQDEPLLTQQAAHVWRHVSVQLLQLLSASLYIVLLTHAGHFSHTLCALQ